MSEQTTQIRNDDRLISTAWEENFGASVGQRGVTKIVPYEENGQGATVTWLAVFKGDHLAARLNCAHLVEITYAPEPQP